MEKNKLSRRDFLKVAGVTSAGLVLSACGIEATEMPTSTTIPATQVPTATITPAPTFTPTPETLVTLKDLSLWVDDYVNAYGGKVTVNGVEMDVVQLTGKIRENPDSFVLTKEINSNKFYFLMVNDVPISVASADSMSWTEASLRILAELKGIEFEFQWAGNDYLRQTNVDISKYASLSKLIGNSFVIGGGLQTQQIFQNFSTKDWRRVLDNWAGIKEQLDGKIVPGGYPYFLDYGRNMIREVTDASTNGQPKMRGMWLMHGGPLMLEEIRAGDFSAQELLNILEFIIKTALLNFPEVQRWDATDELTNAFVSKNINFRYWYRIFDKAPGDVRISDVADLMILIAGWIKDINPDTEAIITEDAILDFNNEYAPWAINAFNQVLENIASKSKSYLFKGIDCENNLWVYDGLNLEKMEANIKKWKDWGFQLYGTETMILSGASSAQRRTKSILSGKVDPIEQQELMYSQLLQFYLDAGAPTFGFGELGDMDNWLEMGDDPLYDTAPGIIDINYRKKRPYFAIAKTLFANL